MQGHPCPSSRRSRPPRRRQRPSPGSLRPSLEHRGHPAEKTCRRLLASQRHQRMRKRRKDRVGCWCSVCPRRTPRRRRCRLVADRNRAAPLSWTRWQNDLRMGARGWKPSDSAVMSCLSMRIARKTREKRVVPPQREQANLSAGRRRAVGESVLDLALLNKHSRAAYRSCVMQRVFS